MRLNFNPGTHIIFMIALIGLTIPATAQVPYAGSAAEKERNKAQVRYQYSKNFKELQINGQKLLGDHKNLKLTPRDLAKQAKNINRNAKTLRSLMALGNLAEKVEIEKDVNTPEEFDESIRRLASLIWEFAHNSIHQNSKIFNTDLAAKAQTDLLTIIDLSKILGDVSREYLPHKKLEE